MSRRRSPPSDFALAVDRASRQPIAEQIHETLRKRIVSGFYGPGLRLPSTRQLSGMLNISRTTVSEAYELLLSDGLVEGHIGSGTFVSEAGASVPTRTPPGPAPAPLSTETAGVSGVIRAFSWGPTLDYFPFDVWQTIGSEQIGRLRELSRLGDPAGYGPLREALAAMLQRWRGMAIDPARIVVTSGMTQGLDIVARTVLRPGDTAVMEDPAEQRVSNTLALAGARIVRVPVDGEGMVTSGLANQDFRLAHLSAVRQYPTGAPLSAEREAELRSFADRRGAYLAEMDNTLLVDSPRRPLLASPDVDPARAIYLATFSWVLFRALRIGFIIAPPDLVPRLLETRFAMDFTPPLIEQAMLARFITDGHFDAYVEKMRAIVKTRQAALAMAWQRELPEGVALSPHPGGIGQMLTLPDGCDTDALLRKAAAYQLAPRDITTWFADPARRALLLGFADAGEATTLQGVGILTDLLNDHLSGSRRTAPGRASIPA